MISLSRLLCPVDFSEFSRHALDYAAALARHHQAGITALHVLPTLQAAIPAGDMGLYPPFVFMPEDIEQFRREVASFARESAGDLPLHAEVIQGNPVAEILRRATELPADLIVLGTHGRTGFERLFLGSVAERVLMKATAPVLTVPRRAPDAVPFGPVPFRSILCAIDFSEASLKALAYARALADTPDTALHAITVLERPPMMEPVMMGGPGTPDHDTHAREHAERQLREWLGDSAARGQVRVEAGKPAAEILRVADDVKADLIVLGAHSGRAGHATFGSTTTRVVRGAVVPVLTLKP